MVSSYRSGYTVRRTVSGVSRMKGSAASRTASASKTKAPRRRRARNLPYLLFLPVYATVQTPLLELLGLLSKFIQGSVVLYHHVGPAGLLLAGELARLYSSQRLLVHTPLGGPRPPPLLGHGYGDRVVEFVAAPTLEQEGYLGHEEVGGGGRYAPLRLAAHQRVQDLLEVPQGLRVSEDLAAERPAVHTALAQDVISEALYDAGDRLLVCGEEVVDNLVGRDGFGAQAPEHIHEGALAGRERAGDSDGHRPLFGSLLCGVPGYFSSRSRSLSASKAPLRKPPSAVRSPRGSRRGRSSLFGRRLKESRRRRASTSMMRASTSSPLRTISSGVSTWCSASSEMWIRPSTPSATSTKAPKETSLVTRPFIVSPTLTRSTISCHGSFLVCLRPSEILSRSLSTSRTLTSTSSPTCTTSLG